MESRPIVTVEVPNVLLVLGTIDTSAVRAGKVHTIATVVVESRAIEVVIKPCVTEAVADVRLKPCAVVPNAVGTLVFRVFFRFCAVTSVEVEVFAHEVEVFNHPLCLSSVVANTICNPFHVAITIAPVAVDAGVSIAPSAPFVGAGKKAPPIVAPIRCESRGDAVERDEARQNASHCPHAFEPQAHAARVAQVGL